MHLTREQVVEYSFRDLLIQLNADVAIAASLAEQYWTEFCRSVVLNPGAESVLNRLAPVFRLGVITNGYIDSQRGRLNASGLTGYFDPLLISEEVGVAKPDARIFEMALDQLEMRPADVLYVGDSISHDRAGCTRAGIDFCHYCPGYVGDDNQANVKFRIAELTDLSPILQSDP